MPRWYPLQHPLPNVSCPFTLLYSPVLTVNFSCWDGVNLDTPNHQDHVAYPVGGPATFLSLGGACPSTHPVRIPQLMYEVVWDTTSFNNKADWPSTGQPFYLSQGDNTGLGQHADYVFGWKGNSLQTAMNASGCMGAKCANLKTQQITSAKSCSVPVTVKENVDGCKWTVSPLLKVTR